MATHTRAYSETSGTIAHASSVNRSIDDIVSTINNLNSANVATSGIDSININASAIIASKIGVTAVLTAHINDKAVTTAKVDDSVLFAMEVFR